MNNTIDHKVVSNSLQVSFRPKPFNASLILEARTETKRHINCFIFNSEDRIVYAGGWGLKIGNNVIRFSKWPEFSPEFPSETYTLKLTDSEFKLIEEIEIRRRA